MKDKIEYVGIERNLYTVFKPDEVGNLKGFLVDIDKVYVNVLKHKPVEFIEFKFNVKV